MKELQRKNQEAMYIQSKDDMYYKVLGSLNFILRLMDSTDDEDLGVVKNEILDLREKIEDLLLDVKYSDK